MTTIAWDGETMAADTMGHSSVKVKIHKLHRLPNGGIFGAAGAMQQILAVLDWLRGGERPGDLDDFEGLLVTPAGVDVLGMRLMRVPSLEPFCAVGSGSHFAIAAMDCGKSAVEAVRLAARWDPYTGGMIDALRLAKPRSK